MLADETQGIVINEYRILVLNKYASLYHINKLHSIMKLSAASLSRRILDSLHPLIKLAVKTNKLVLSSKSLVRVL